MASKEQRLMKVSLPKRVSLPKKSFISVVTIVTYAIGAHSLSLLYPGETCLALSFGFVILTVVVLEIRLKTLLTKDVQFNHSFATLMMAEHTCLAMNNVAEPENRRSDWTKQYDCQIISANQSGTGGDHRLKVEGSTVSCNGLRTAENTKFTIYSRVPQSSSEFTYVMLECSGGDCHDYMVCLENDRVYARKRRQIYLTLAQAIEEGIAVFKRKSTSRDEEYTFESLLYEEQYLGFDTSGRVITPSAVNKSASEAFFIVQYSHEAAEGGVDHLQG